MTVDGLVRAGALRRQTRVSTTSDSRSARRVVGVSRPATNKSKKLLTLDLYDADMRRFGGLLADSFCRSLSGGDRYFEEDVATRFEEAAA